MSSCGIRDRMSPGEPWMTMSFPGCCFSFETSAAISPLTRCELFHSSLFRVLEATCLGMLLNRSANPSGSLRLGHAAAKPSYVTRPRRTRRARISAVGTVADEDMAGARQVRIDHQDVHEIIMDTAAAGWDLHLTRRLEKVK